MKLLIWLLLIFFAVVWLKKKAVKGKVVPESKPVAALPNGEKMVPCAHCGLHVPASEAVSGFSGASFCDEEHRRLGTKR